jgi:hypothetical protein
MTHNVYEFGPLSKASIEAMLFQSNSGLLGSVGGSGQKLPQHIQCSGVVYVILAIAVLHLESF